MRKNILSLILSVVLIVSSGLYFANSEADIRKLIGGSTRTAAGGLTCTTADDVELFAYTDTPGAIYGVNNANWIGIRFVCAVPTRITQLLPYMEKASIFGNTIASIYTDSGNEPDSEVAGTSVTVVNNTLPASGSPDYVEFTLVAPVNIAAGTYWLTVRGDSEEYSRVFYSAEVGYWSTYSYDNGSTWDTYEDEQLLMKIRGCQ